MTTDTLKRLLDRQSVRGQEFALLDELTPDSAAALASLALAAHAAQAVEHAEACPIRESVRNGCTCGLHNLDAALAAVFSEGDDHAV